MADLPGAIVEETFWPDEIVLIPNDDGSYHMCLYVGRQEEGFLMLKHVIISPEHAAMFVRAPQPEPVIPAHVARVMDAEPPQLITRWTAESVQQAPVLDPDIIV